MESSLVSMAELVRGELIHARDSLLSEPAVKKWEVDRCTSKNGDIDADYR